VVAVIMTLRAIDKIPRHRTDVVQFRKCAVYYYSNINLSHFTPAIVSSGHSDKRSCDQLLKCWKFLCCTDSIVFSAT